MSIAILLATLFVAPPPAEPMYQNRSLSAWMRDLASPDEAVIARAVGALTAMGPVARPALPALVDLAFSTEADRALIRPVVRLAIGKIGLPDPAHLAIRLETARSREDALEQLTVLRMLYLHGPQAKPAQAQLVRELCEARPATQEHPHRGQCRAAAMGALAQIGPQVMPELIATAAERTVDSPLEGLPFVAVVQLFEARAVPALVEALQSGTPAQKRFAASAFESLRANGVAGLEALKMAEQGSDSTLSRLARQSRREIELGRLELERSSSIVGVGTMGPLAVVAASQIAPPTPPRPEMHALPPPPVLSVPLGGLDPKWLLLAGAGVVLGGWVVYRLSHRTGSAAR